MSDWYFVYHEAKMRQSKIQEELDRARLLKQIRLKDKKSGFRPVGLAAKLGRIMVRWGLWLQKLERVPARAKAVDMARPMG